MIDDILITKDEQNLLDQDSLIKVYDIMSFDPQRFFHKIGEVGDGILVNIKFYLKKHFGIVWEEVETYLVVKLMISQQAN